MIDDSPHDGTDDEVIALDLALDAVARRDYRDTDPVLAALAGFAQEIDDRATARTLRRRAGAAPQPRRVSQADGRHRFGTSQATYAAFRPHQPTR